VAVRYTFDELFGKKVKGLKPFVELGSWAAPQASLTMSRPYANGTGTSTGSGGTQAASWAEYARAGLSWDANTNNKFSVYGELGQQYMSFDAYNETIEDSNPFPASVNNGLVRQDIVRAGGAWTHKLDNLFDKLTEITLVGAIAHSFNGQSGLTVNVAGIGTSTASFERATWGEFGARVESQLTEHIAVNFDITGTTGDNEMDTAIHGGVGLSYRF
jgi:hypothetical protein